MFKVAMTPNEMLKVYCVRNIVFVEEQQCPYPIEFDGLDGEAIHVLGEAEGEPFAAARIRFVEEYAKLERIAVRAAWRGQGIGQKLVDFMLQTARAQGYRHYKMHAQAHLTEFYRRLGFEPMGELFVEAGIDHYLMVRHDEG